jgi:chromosome segregation ATPase
LSKGNLSADVNSLRTKKFDKRENNELAENIQHQITQIHDEVQDLHQDLMRCKDDIKQTREEVCVNRGLINDIDNRREPGGSMS